MLYPNPPLSIFLSLNGFILHAFIEQLVIPLSSFFSIARDEKTSVFISNL